MSSKRSGVMPACEFDWVRLTRPSEPATAVIEDAPPTVATVLAVTGPAASVATIGDEAVPIGRREVTTRA